MWRGATPGLCLAILESLDGLPTLVGRQLRRAAEFHTTGHCAGTAITCTGKDQLALELGKPAQYLFHIGLLMPARDSRAVFF
jgi:hypothetical protein